MTVLKADNYTIIQGWMLTDLGLKGNELLVYAVIYGFSQTEGQVFSGSLRYLAEWTNSTKRGVMNNLKSLIDKGYIEKKDNIVNGVKFCEYYVTKFTGVVKKVHWGMEKSSIGGMEKSSPNNIDIDNKEDKKEIKKEKRHAYGEYKNVFLSDKELTKLKEEYPKDWQGRIEAVSSYCASKGKAYKNYLATIRSWAQRDAKQAASRPASKDDYIWCVSEPDDDLPF